MSMESQLWRSIDRGVPEWACESMDPDILGIEEPQNALEELGGCEDLRQSASCCVARMRLDW